MEQTLGLFRQMIILHLITINLPLTDYLTRRYERSMSAELPIMNWVPNNIPFLNRRDIYRIELWQIPTFGPLTTKKQLYLYMVILPVYLSVLYCPLSSNHIYSLMNIAYYNIRVTKEGKNGGVLLDKWFLAICLDNLDW